MMSGSNSVKNVAIVGAGGQSGKWITEELIRGGKHTVTAITRETSQAQLPEGIHRVEKVNYDSPESLIHALQGQDVLVITLSVFAQKTHETNLVEAAIKAGVPFILPNEWSPDTFNEDLCRDVAVFASKGAIRKFVKETGGGKTSFISVTTSFWYEYMLPLPNTFGFDFAAKAVTFFDEGTTKITTSTWPQMGRAVASLLSLLIESSSGVCLSQFKNQQVRVSSFTVSQKDMFESILRVTNDKKEDWKVSYESAQERYHRGLEAMKKGDRQGMAIAMSTRIFFKDGAGNVETAKGLHNDVLRLPAENIDKFTQIAIQKAARGPMH